MVIKIPYKDKESKIEWQRERRKQRKLQLLQYKLNKKCSKCGYKKHPEILQFHHRNKEEKSFNFSGGNIGNRSWEIIEAEINKCDLLCPNCHNWEHYKEKDTFFKKIGSKWKTK